MRKILSLCDYSGAWSKPYADAGYEVVQVDLQHGSNDVRLLCREDDVHGILSAPPVPVLQAPAQGGNGLTRI